MARPTKPFFAPWLGKHITGLCRQPDGRWRIVATGERFREPDERRAVEHFLGQTGQANPGQILVGEQAPGAKVKWDEEAMGRSLAEQRATGVRFAWTVEGNTMQAGVWVPEDLLWRWFTEQLATRPDYVARRTGVAALATLPDHAVPRPSLKLEALLDLYKEHADVGTPLGAEPLNEVEGDDGSAMMVPFPRESTRYVEPTRASRIWGRSSGGSFCRPSRSIVHQKGSPRVRAEPVIRMESAIRSSGSGKSAAFIADWIEFGPDPRSFKLCWRGRSFRKILKRISALLVACSVLLLD